MCIPVGKWLISIYYDPVCFWGIFPSTHIPNSIWILNVVNHLLAGVHILQDQEREREDQMCASRGDSPLLSRNCGKVIEKNGGFLGSKGTIPHKWMGANKGYLKQTKSVLEVWISQHRDTSVDSTGMDHNLRPMCPGHCCKLFPVWGA